MRKLRQAARRDTNEAEIIAALRKIGASVVQLSVPNVPDLLVGFTDPTTSEPSNVLMEVKYGRNPLEAGQQAFIEAWQGQVFVVYSIEDALEAIGR
jgi:hypothetical protein